MSRSWTHLTTEPDGGRFSLKRVLRRPPGPVLIVVVTVACAMELVGAWSLGGDLRPDFFLLVFVSGLLLLVCLARIVAALGHPQKTWMYWLRVAIGPVLLIGSFALLAGGVPMQVRFELSETSLNAYVRTLSDLPADASCERSTFTRRRVGLFTIECVDRPVAGVVTLSLRRDALTPSAQAWYLVWEQTPDPQNQRPLSSHWSLALED